MANAIALTEVIVNNTYTGSFDLIPYHGVRDKAHFNELVDSMQQNGWVGAPVVQYGGQLLTGSHRYAAAKEAGVDLDVVDLTDIFCLDEEEINELIGEVDNWVVEATYLAIADNSKLAEILGLDAH